MVNSVGLERLFGMGVATDGEERESGGDEMIGEDAVVDPPARDFSTAIFADDACSSLRQ